MLRFLPALTCAVLACGQPVLAADDVSTRLPGSDSTWTQGKICTAEYRPVCGMKNGRWKNYSNRCRAEVDGASAIRPGKCPRGKAGTMLRR